MRLVWRTVLLVLALGASCHGYVIKPTSLHELATATAGERLWKPTHAMKIHEGFGAFRLSRSPDTCNRDCLSAAALFREDGSATVFDLPNFCAGAGAMHNGTLLCFGPRVQGAGDRAMVSQFRYTFDGDTIAEEQTPAPAEFTCGELDVADVMPVSNVLFFEEKGLYLCSAELVLKNGTVLHGFFRSSNAREWNLTSVVPFPAGRETSILRLGETKLTLVTGSPGAYVQATSVFLGTRWEKMENVSYATPLSTWSSPHRTTIYGGVRGRPGVTAMAAGPKKGTEKPINLVEHHNKLATKQGGSILNFTTEYAEATSFDCLREPLSRKGVDGCASSSYVSVVSLSNGTFFVVYDMLENGFAPADADHVSRIFGMKFSLNETKEENEAAARAEELKKEAEREAAREEARKKAQKETEERKRRERREKIRKDKERRAQFNERDQVYLADAARWSQVDRETIIVRDVDPDFTDIEKDTFMF